MQVKILIPTALLLLCFFPPALLSATYLPIDPAGQSSLHLVNNTGRSVKIAIENWQLLPWIAQEIDTTVVAGDTVQFTLVTQGNTYFRVQVNEEDFQLFAQPDAVNQVVLDENDRLSFRGQIASINRYLYRKKQQFNNINADWEPRVNFTHGGYDLHELIAGNDSITHRHQLFLEEHRGELPDWYYQFESDRLRYLNGGFILNSLIYRNKLLGQKDVIPPTFLRGMLDTLSLEREDMLGNIRYLLFLHDYLGFINDPAFEKAIPSNRQTWEQHFTDRVALITKSLEGLVRDVYLSFSLSSIIMRKRQFFDPTWLSLIQQQELRQYMTDLWERHGTAPSLKGQSAPYFYLTDQADRYYTPADLEGKVVLINFWATWCRPCIAEFPLENQLVDMFSGQAVQIVNICLDSNREKWESLIAQHGLRTLNLFANDNWSEKLYESYQFSALPHSVLIDRKGNIVTPGSRRASEGVAEDIKMLLDQ